MCNYLISYSPYFFLNGLLTFPSLYFQLEGAPNGVVRRTLELVGDLVRRVGQEEYFYRRDPNFAVLDQTVAKQTEALCGEMQRWARTPLSTIGGGGGGSGSNFPLPPPIPDQRRPIVLQYVRTLLDFVTLQPSQLAQPSGEEFLQQKLRYQISFLCDQIVSRAKRAAVSQL